MVTVLKLHGSIGWHPLRAQSEVAGDGAIGQTSGPSFECELPVLLEHNFLWKLGITARDSRFEPYPGQNEDVLIHPSFLKDFEGTAFRMLWRRAAEQLRQADEVVVAGYSLPAEDSAALTLLQTNPDPMRVKIVNQNPVHFQRLRRLLSTSSEVIKPLSFEQWLEKA